MKIHTLTLHPEDAENQLTSQSHQGKRILSITPSHCEYKESLADALRCRHSWERCLVGMDPVPAALGQAESRLESWLDGVSDPFK